MFVEILQFLTNNKTIVVGATVAIGEVIVVLANVYRRFKNERKALTVMDAVKKSLFSVSNLLWAANPRNLFRKP